VNVQSFYFWSQTLSSFFPACLSLPEVMQAEKRDQANFPVFPQHYLAGGRADVVREVDY
jgi:hypothetical protein